MYHKELIEIINLCNEAANVLSDLQEKTFELNGKPVAEIKISEVALKKLKEKIESQLSKELGVEDIWSEAPLKQSPEPLILYHEGHIATRCDGCNKWTTWRCTIQPGNGDPVRSYCFTCSRDWHLAQEPRYLLDMSGKTCNFCGRPSERTYFKKDTEAYMACTACGFNFMNLCLDVDLCPIIEINGQKNIYDPIDIDEN